jgi:predicted Zn-dependent peptidase
MRKLILFLLVIQGVLMGAIVDNIKVKDLDIPFIYEIDNNLPTVNLQIVFQNSGSIKNTKAGLTTLVAKLLNEGTKELGSVKFANKLESHAIDLSAQSGTETFVLEISCLKSEIKYAISLLQDLLKDPNYTKDTFDKIVNISLGHLMQKESDFDYIASIELKSKLFKDTPLEKPSSGTIESIKEITLEDIKEFVSSNLVVANAIVVAGGDIDTNEIKEYSIKTLDILPKGTSTDLIDVELSKDVTSSEIYKETQQAYVYFGSPYYVDVQDKDAYISKVANFILGSSGFGSRLMEEIRVKRGLAYSAYSRAAINRSHSYFSGYLQTKLESKDEAIKIVKDIISEYIKNGATQKELDGAKKFILGSEPLRNETLSQRLSRTFLEYYKGLEIGAGIKDLEKIENLTLDELNSFIKKHSEINNLTFAVVTKEENKK